MNLTFRDIADLFVLRVPERMRVALALRLSIPSQAALHAEIERLILCRLHVQHVAIQELCVAQDQLAAALDTVRTVQNVTVPLSRYVNLEDDCEDMERMHSRFDYLLEHYANLKETTHQMVDGLCFFARMWREFSHARSFGGVRLPSDVAFIIASYSVDQYISPREEAHPTPTRSQFVGFRSFVTHYLPHLAVQSHYFHDDCPSRALSVVTDYLTFGENVSTISRHVAHENLAPAEQKKQVQSRKKRLRTKTRVKKAKRAKS